MPPPDYWGTFSTSSIPTLTQVEQFLTNAHDQMASWLEEAGYSSTQTDADVLGALEPYNAYGGAYMVELTQPSVSWEPREGSRAYLFKQLFEEAKKLIGRDGLQLLGATKSKQLSRDLAAGGISISDKDTIEEDTDHPPYWFYRDLHQHPSTVKTTEEQEQ